GYRAGDTGRIEKMSVRIQLGGPSWIQLTRQKQMIPSLQPNDLGNARQRTDFTGAHGLQFFRRNLFCYYVELNSWLEISRFIAFRPIAVPRLLHYTQGTASTSCIGKLNFVSGLELLEPIPLDWQASICLD